MKIRRIPVPMAMAAFVTAAVAQTPSPAAVPKFEVASIKACKPDAPRERGATANLSPGRLHIPCQTARELVEAAYVMFVDGRTMRVPGRVAISGGPSWIHADRFELDAKAETPETQEMMHGPMLQALLAERFHLQIRRETKEIPVYALTVTKGGPKLKPFEEGTCIPVDLSKATLAGLGSRQPGVAPCKNRGGRKNGMETYDAQAATLDEFCAFDLMFMDRPVINKTGIAGRFEIHLEFAPEIVKPGSSSAASEPAGPTIFTALKQQLGLQLEPARGPGEFLIIERIEKPTDN